jgi:hypothetical protein
MVNTQTVQEVIGRLSGEKIIVLDTSLLLSDGYKEFFPLLYKALGMLHKPVVLPNVVLDELSKKYSTQVDPKLSEKAHYAIQTLDKLMNTNLIVVLQNKLTDTHADPDILSLLMEERIKKEILLITRDRKLASDALMLNKMSSTLGKAVYVDKIGRNGELYEFVINDMTYKIPFSGFKSSKPAPPPGVKTFNPPAPAPAQNLNVSFNPKPRLPKEGDRVTLSTGEQTILKVLLYFGGEAEIYEAQNGSLIKIYNSHSMSEDKLKKQQELLKENKTISNTCFPKALARNSQGDYVGFSMDRAKGHTLAKSVMLKPLFLQKFADWKKIDLVILAKGIAQKVYELHRAGFILGDINSSNIIVDSPESFCFVDCDSYQYKNYKCSVGYPEFVPPELFNKDMSKITRTLAHDNYSLAALLFAILMGGKKPYSNAGLGSIVENVLQCEFVYPLGTKTTGVAPVGESAYIWSNLAYNLKSAFYNTFHREGKYFRPDLRLQPSDWQRLLHQYEFNLKNQRFTDPQSYLCFPNGYKQVSTVI